eukprot:comp19725_c0_seq1/m.37952 comp19725_c0_seq1/g.37952  ORF comp19725_c0_seq1/g.37952 comp19725_c0_seq1/m.37952 type:complete len:325 (-) comp19725_c0_seq1:368-1342(-)
MLHLRPGACTDLLFAIRMHRSSGGERRRHSRERLARNQRHCNRPLLDQCTRARRQRRRTSKLGCNQIRLSFARVGDPHAARRNGSDRKVRHKLLQPRRVRHGPRLESVLGIPELLEDPRCRVLQHNVLHLHGRPGWEEEHQLARMHLGAKRELNRVLRGRIAVARIPCSSRFVRCPRATHAVRSRHRCKLGVLCPRGANRQQRARCASDAMLGLLVLLFLFFFLLFLFLFFCLFLLGLFFLASNIVAANGHAFVHFRFRCKGRVKYHRRILLLLLFLLLFICMCSPRRSMCMDRHLFPFRMPRHMALWHRAHIRLLCLPKRIIM